ncbi:MAG: hypothetical protein KZQ73_00650 [Candidatus Thiodiazotropha sp. (ex Semelilucina semeliformis)]|nr:hypothetical protein [Candidatus Thiodiazotropha sp. (ex Semelilucina semeliformis)]
MAVESVLIFILVYGLICYEQIKTSGACQIIDVTLTALVLSVFAFVLFDYFISPSVIDISESRIILKYKGKKDKVIFTSSIIGLLHSSWRTGPYSLRLYTNKRDYIDILVRWDFDRKTEKKIIGLIVNAIVKQ